MNDFDGRTSWSLSEPWLGCIILSILSKNPGAKGKLALQLQNPALLRRLPIPIGAPFKRVSSSKNFANYLSHWAIAMFRPCCDSAKPSRKVCTAHKGWGGGRRQVLQVPPNVLQAPSLCVDGSQSGVEELNTMELLWMVLLLTINLLVSVPFRGNYGRPNPIFSAILMYRQKVTEMSRNPKIWLHLGW